MMIDIMAFYDSDEGEDNYHGDNDDSDIMKGM
jgi:hypothetical protein